MRRRAPQYRGADKSLARPWRKQATATKLLQATQKKLRRLSVQPGLRGSNDLRVGRKMATFQLFFQLGRAKDLSAPLYNRSICTWNATSWRVLNWNTHKQNSPKTSYKLQLNGCNRQRLPPECLMTKINRSLVLVVPDTALGRPEIVVRHDARLGMKD